MTLAEKVKKELKLDELLMLDKLLCVSLTVATEESNDWEVLDCVERLQTKLLGSAK